MTKSLEDLEAKEVDTPTQRFEHEEFILETWDHEDPGCMMTIRPGPVQFNQTALHTDHLSDQGKEALCACILEALVEDEDEPEDDYDY